MQLRKLAGPAIACPGSLFAQAGHAAGDSDCQYEVTPCFLAASLDGTVGVRGVKTDIDVPFSDIRDHLEAGFTGLFSAHKGPWTFMPEALYFRLDGDSSGSVTGPFGRVTPDGALDLTNERYIYQGTAGDRVFDSGTTVDLLAAARYTKVKAEMEVRLDTNPGIVFPGGEISADGSKSWTDAVAGVHALHPVSDKVSLLGYADVGGRGGRPDLPVPPRRKPGIQEGPHRQAGLPAALPGLRGWRLYQGQDRQRCPAGAGHPLLNPATPP